MMRKKIQLENEKIYMEHRLDEKPNPTDYSEMHTHDHAEIYIFLAGEGTYYVEGTPYPLKPGHILVMRQHEFHCVHIKEGTPYERIIINFKQELIGQSFGGEVLLKSFLERPQGRFNQYHLKDIFQEYYPCFIDKLIYVEGDELAHGLSHLHYLLHGIYLAYQRRGSAREEEISHKSYEIISYINHHLLDDLSLEHLCQEFFMSKSQLGRLFKKTTGASVWDYIISKRLVFARQLIQGGTSATEACFQAGFSDYTSFYKSYKNKFQCSPRRDKKSSSLHL